MERLFLQIAVAVSAFVLIVAGLAGVFMGVELLHGRNGGMVDSYFRFLAAVAAGMGVMFAATIPHIETHGERMGTLAFLIFAGGLAHLYGFILKPTPTVGTFFALSMELIVFPLLWLGQRHIAHRSAGSR